MRLGYDNINTYIMGLDLYTFLDKLKVITYTYFHRLGSGKQPVIISFAPPYPVTATVKPYCRDHNKFDLRYIACLIALRLFDVKGAKRKTGAVVWQNFEIQTIDTGQEKALACMPPIYEFEC